MQVIIPLGPIMAECRCWQVDASDGEANLKEFEAVRAVCSALHRIVVPDDIWDAYRQFCESESDKAFHAPIAYLAFQQRYLAALTGPIHAYCLDGHEPSAALTAQYRNDLAERWMFRDDARQRFENARIFQGRLAELSFADWLEHEDWNIDALEAKGANVDVEATSSDGIATSFEVKHLGQDAVLFDLGIKALQSNGVSVGYIPVYSPVDYMLYRVYEAARQLGSVANRKIVVVILSKFDVYFELPLKEGWIDWKAPQFLRKDGDIDEFLAARYAENPALDEDMKQYISRLDEIWFFDEPSPLSPRRRRIEQLRQ